MEFVWGLIVVVVVLVAFRLWDWIGDVVGELVSGVIDVVADMITGRKE